MKTEQRLLEELAKIDVAKLTSEMVKIPSYSFMEEQEREIARRSSRSNRGAIT